MHAESSTLLGKLANNKWGVLCQVIAPVEWGTQGAEKELLFHQDNTQVPRFDGENHGPLYSPNSSPSDSFVFSNLKNWVGRKRFTSNVKAIAQTDPYFEGLKQSYLLGGLKKLHQPICWKIKRRLAKIICLSFSKDFLSHPRMNH